MPRSKIKLVAIILSLVLGGAWSWPANQKSAANKRAPKQTAVDRVRIVNADKEPGNWMTHGRTYDEQRFSPLKQINDGNVSQLGLAWYFDMDTDRGQESTPIVVDGVMYFTSAWSKVFAVNAETGSPLWSYDPKVPPEWGANACCDVVNRGVAIWQHRVFVGTLDGRLVALDAATGKPVWETLTVDRQFRYTITGAPRIVDGKVIIGNGGAEFGVRGYVSAYDAQTGKMLWRFYTFPGDPSKPFESPALERAAKTWTGEWWKAGGGGTVWDSIVYDPELDLIYLGVGNGSPWNRRIRSPGGGDNLYLSSIVAIKAKTGEYVWHYQETPGEMWDYTATQQIILADIAIDGRQRKVILHAPKNGFFYVLDRATGALISAKPYTFVTWATSIDMKTGRPVESVNARYPGAEGVPLAPGPLGAHNWQPMSFSPLSGFVYIPVQDMGFLYKSQGDYQSKALAFNTGLDMVAAELPQDPNIKKLILDTVKGRLVAWDPVKQKQVWNVNRPGPWNGGVLSTAGNLVFEGTASGSFEAYRADTGEKVWSFAAQTGVMAGPVSYTVNGEQYVAVAAGWGGAFPLVVGEISFKSGRVRNISRMLVFKLGGKAALPALVEPATLALNPPAATADEATVKRGEGLFQRYCSPCHGDVAVGGGVVPDLRYSKTLANEKWFDVVLGGARKQNGMISFAKELTRKDAADILAYVIARANQGMNESKREK
ncbi:MAG TPA: PQQ-dependent dehydrogenase, methanol/ethanol family [Blastocatellia bacterium]|nr:PQQ-dependent dehydrogenase, methanol/ethanol family [Blastocatellia bacterium]